MGSASEPSARPPPPTLSQLLIGVKKGGLENLRLPCLFSSICFNICTEYESLR